ncbi:MAG TPA: hypothetical protein VFP91_10710 [Vicinamibacterales bacterium]|nr:hypothetical protein [Vicinamibacterales bacterium]
MSVPKSGFRTSKPTLQDIDFDLHLGHAGALDIQLPPILVNVLTQFIDEIAHAAVRPPLSMKRPGQLVNR